MLNCSADPSQVNTHPDSIMRHLADSAELWEEVGLQFSTGSAKSPTLTSHTCCWICPACTTICSVELLLLAVYCSIALQFQRWTRHTSVRVAGKARKKTCDNCPKAEKFASSYSSWKANHLLPVKWRLGHSHTVRAAASPRTYLLHGTVLSFINKAGIFI